MTPPIPAPPRGRQRLPSGDDVPIPESVFGALHGLQQAVDGVASEMRAGFAAQAQTNAVLAEKVEKASALSIERWTNLAKALVPAVVAIVGGVVGVQKLTTPSAPQLTEVPRTAYQVDLDACASLPESNQRACVAAAFEREQARKLGSARR